MPAAFDVLTGFPKGLGGEVVAMEWCPTMDLIAIATSDSQVSVYRVTWQRLFAISTSHSVHCIAWRPDGQQLAVGMSDGSVAFYNVEDGELLSTSTMHSCPLRLLAWLPTSSADSAGRGRDSAYACPISDLFPPLPVLSKGSGSQQLIIDAGPMQLDVPMHRLLFEGERTLNFDIALSADESARVHLAVHGRFSLGFLSLAHFPALDFGGEAPALLSASLAPSLHALTLVVQTKAPTRASLPDGTRQLHPPGALVLGFRTGQLSRARAEIEALALSFTQCRALAERAGAAVGMAGRAWSEATAGFSSKMDELSAVVRQLTDLDPSDGPATVCQELLLQLATGSPAPQVLDFLSHSWREPELSRSLKAAAAAADTVAQLCVTQAAPALEMLIHLLGHLHGLSKWPHHFAVTLGLQPKNVLTVLEAAESLRASVELLLICSRRTDHGIAALMCWLIHTVRKLRDESPPAVSEVPLPDARRVAAFLSRASPGPASGIPVDEVADLFLEAPGEAAAAAGLPRDALDGVSGLGPIGRLGPAVAKLNAALADAFTPVAQHVSAGFQLHSCSPLDTTPAATLTAPTTAPSLTLDVLHADPPPPPPSPPPARTLPGAPPPPPQPPPPPLVVAATLGAAGLEQDTAGEAAPGRDTAGGSGGVRLVLLRASWQLQDKGPPQWEACAVHVALPHLRRALFYRDSRIALMHAGSAAEGTHLTVASYASLPFVPLAKLAAAGSSAGIPAASQPILGLVQAAVASGQLPLVRLEGERSRHFPSVMADRLALAPRRGMGSLVLTQKRRIFLLDLEEEGEEGGEGGQEEGGGAGREVDAEPWPGGGEMTAALASPAGQPTPSGSEDDMDMDEG